MIPRACVNRFVVSGAHCQAIESHDMIMQKMQFQIPWYAIGSTSIMREDHGCGSARAQIESSESAPAYFLFNKQSTPTLLQSMSAEDLSRGCFLALCRVIVHKVRTIATDFTKDELMDAKRVGYDAVYSLKRSVN